MAHSVNKILYGEFNHEQALIPICRVWECASIIPTRELSVNTVYSDLWVGETLSDYFMTNFAQFSQKKTKIVRIGKDPILSLYMEERV
jgi:hypothetical protein